MPRERFVPTVINPDACHLCGRCYNTCRSNAITMKGRERHVDLTQCTGCLQCVLVCPYNTITVTSALEGETIAVRVEEASCNGCMQCVATCPASVIEQTSTKVASNLARIRYCKGCKACEATCPSGAIRVVQA